jgi:hypothetical protein
MNRGIMKRKLKWLAVVLAVLLVGFSAALFLWPRDRITKASWEKIRLGMQEKEVEDILGGPGLTGDYPPEFSLVMSGGVTIFDEKQYDFRNHRRRYWIGRGGALGISIDHEGIVRLKSFHKLLSLEPSFLDRLRDSLGW